MPRHTSLLEDVFYNADILECIVGCLYRPDAARFSAISKSVRAIIKANKIEHKPRLLVVASESNCLCELDLLTGELVQKYAVRPRARGWKRQKGGSLDYWPTCLAMHEGYIHICQYKGNQVLRFSPNNLSYLSTTARMSSSGECPEGIAFSKGCLYIASAAAGHIRRFVPHPDGNSFLPASQYLSASIDLIGSPQAGRRLQVPWGMVTGPDGNLYIAMDDEFEDGDDALASTSGHIMVGILGPEGELISLRPFCGLLDSLARPSGLCFDDQGNFYVTCMTSRILQYSGPLADNPGQLMRVAAQWALPGEERGQGPNKPWDVRWHKGIAGIGAKAEPLLVVTRHAGMARRCGSNIAVFSAVSGRLLKHLRFTPEQARHLRQANMMIID